MMKKGIILSLLFLFFVVSCGGSKSVKKDKEATNPNRAQETGYATIFDKIGRASCRERV